VRLAEADGASDDHEFSKPFGIEDLHTQDGSTPDVESVIRDPTRHPDDEVVMATPENVGRN
jgi:hypothetical protein